MSMFLAVLLAWDLSAGVTGYKIYWRFAGDDWGSHVVDVGNVTQAEIDEPWPMDRRSSSDARHTTRPAKADTATSWSGT